MNAYKNIAQRITNAEANMIATLGEIAGITEADATKAFATFRKVKAIKLDAVGGRYIVKHGAYMDAEVIRRAVVQS